MKEVRELVKLKKRYVKLRVLYGKTTDPKTRELLKREIGEIVKRAREIRRRVALSPRN